MKKANNLKIAKTTNAYYSTRVSKLACGQSFTVPGYGTVKAYRSKAGKRMFSVSGNKSFPNGGNLKPITIICEVRCGAHFSV